MPKYQFQAFLVFFQHLSRDINILESRHHHFGVVASAFVSHDISTLALLLALSRQFFCFVTTFFCYVATLAILSHDISILSCDINILAQFLALSRIFLFALSRHCFALSRHFFYLAASFSSPTCQGHNFFILIRIWTCKDSLESYLNVEFNHGEI